MSPTVATSGGGASSSSARPIRSLTHAKYMAFIWSSLVHDVLDACLHIVPAGVERQQGGDPEQDEPRLGDARHDEVGGAPGDEEAEGDELQGRLPLGDLADRHRHLELGQI